MTYLGRVKNGVVVLDGGSPLADGTVVKVEPVPPTRAGADENDLFRAGNRAKPTGIPDLSINHDHYLYGHPKVSDG